jgi:hypothetical protein
VQLEAGTSEVLTGSDDCAGLQGSVIMVIHDWIEVLYIINNQTKDENHDLDSEV